MSTRPEDHRRKWDKDEFEKIAAERLKAELEEEERSKKKGIFYYVCNVSTLNMCTKSSLLRNRRYYFSYTIY